MDPIEKQTSTEVPKQTNSHKETSSWRVGRQTIVLGDCLTALQKIESASIDVVITSPPYNIGVPYRSYDDKRPREGYLLWLQEISKALGRVLKPDGSLFLNSGSTNSDPWLAMDVAGSFRKDFVLQNNIVWVKSISIRDNSFGHFKPIISRRFLNQNQENVFHFSKTGSVEVDRLAVGVAFKDKRNISRWGHTLDKRCAGNVWFIPYETVQSRAQKFNHPAGFPLGLPSRCILLHGRSDLTVLDPFLGAGTTLVAAEQLGHQGIGIELDPQYVETSISRLSARLYKTPAPTGVSRATVL